jgi:hypothetical protein
MNRGAAFGFDNLRNHGTFMVSPSLSAKGYVDHAGTGLNPSAPGAGGGGGDAFQYTKMQAE